MKILSKHGKETALNYIKNQIITCAMMPGSTIQIDEIAEHLNISKIPVREALLALQHDGYVTVIPRKKTIVSKISLQDLKDIYDARVLIESFVIENITEKCAENNMESFLLLRKTWEGIDISNQSREAYMDFLHSDINFHLTLVSLESNPYIVNLCQELIYKSQRFWYVALFNNDMHTVREEHLNILDAIIRHDAEAAAAACKKHISVSKALSILSD